MMSTLRIQHRQQQLHSRRVLTGELSAHSPVPAVCFPYNGALGANASEECRLKGDMLKVDRIDTKSNGALPLCAAAPRVVVVTANQELTFQISVMIFFLS
jgi:hypothetical protein